MPQGHREPLIKPPGHQEPVPTPLGYKEPVRKPQNQQVPASIPPGCCGEQLRGLLDESNILLVMPINAWSKYLYLYSLHSMC